MRIRCFVRRPLSRNKVLHVSETSNMDSQLLCVDANSSTKKTCASNMDLGPTFTGTDGSREPSVPHCGFPKRVEVSGILHSLASQLPGWLAVWLAT